MQLYPVEEQVSFDNFLLISSCLGRLLVWGAAIPIAFISIRYFLHREWVRALRIIAILGVVALLLWGLEIPLYRINHRIHLSKIFDTRVNFDSPLFEYDSPRAFNGDGYSITVYGLPDCIRDRFSSFDQLLETEFPKRPEYRSHWETEYWKTGPLPKGERKYLRFASEYYWADERPQEIQKNIRDMKLALRSENSFYAYHYYLHGDSVGDIDFFVIDIEKAHVFIINHNT